MADDDMAIKLDPNFAGAYYNRGNSHLEAGDKDGQLPTTGRRSGSIHTTSKPPRCFSRLKQKAARENPSFSLLTAYVRSWQCAPKARITSGGRFHPESCRLIW
jgi:hypothetical protein